MLWLGNIFVTNKTWSKQNKYFRGWLKKTFDFLPSLWHVLKVDNKKRKQNSSLIFAWLKTERGSGKGGAENCENNKKGQIWLKNILFNGNQLMGNLVKACLSGSGDGRGEGIPDWWRWVVTPTWSITKCFQTDTDADISPQTRPGRLLDLADDFYESMVLSTKDLKWDKSWQYYTFHFCFVRISRSGNLFRSFRPSWWWVV